MVAISGAPSRQNTVLQARRNRHLTISIAAKTPGPRKPKFGQQSLVVQESGTKRVRSVAAPDHDIPFARPPPPVNKSKNHV